MKDERINELAGAILTQAAKLLETNKGPNPNYRLTKADNNKWSFTYTLNTPFGNLVGYYNPFPAVKMMVRDKFELSGDRTPEIARANFKALFTSVLRLIHNFPTMMRLTLKKHSLLSLAHPLYELDEFLLDRLRAHGEDVPARRFKDVLDRLPALKEISELERRLAGVSRSGRPRNKNGAPQAGQDKQATTLSPFSLGDGIGGILGLPLLSEYEREQYDLWRKVFWAVYRAKMQGVANEYLHQEYLANEILCLDADDDASPTSAARRLRRALKKYGLDYSEIRRAAIQAAKTKKKVKRRPKTDI
jgi:hypothetical protein